MQTLAEHLLHLEGRGVLCRRTLARLWRCSESHVSRVLSEEREATATQTLDVLRWLSERGEHGAHRLALAPSHHVCVRAPAGADGRIDDEARDLMAASGRLVQAHMSGNAREMRAALDAVRAITARCDAEADRL